MSSDSESSSDDETMFSMNSQRYEFDDESMEIMGSKSYRVMKKDDIQKNQQDVTTYISFFYSVYLKICCCSFATQLCN